MPCGPAGRDVPLAGWYQFHPGAERDWCSFTTQLNQFRDLVRNTCNDSSAGLAEWFDLGISLTVGALLSKEILDQAINYGFSREELRRLIVQPTSDLTEDPEGYDAYWQKLDTALTHFRRSSSTVETRQHCIDRIIYEGRKKNMKNPAIVVLQQEAGIPEADVVRTTSSQQDAADRHAKRHGLECIKICGGRPKKPR